MNISIPKVALVLLIVVGALLSFGRRGGDEPAGSGEPAVTEPAASGPAALVDRARGSSLQAAFRAAVGAADCGYTEVGYDHRTAGEEARRLVDLLGSAGAASGGAASGTGEVTYAEGRATGPWQVVLRADGDALVVEGFARDLDRPAHSRRVPCE